MPTGVWLGNIVDVVITITATSHHPLRRQTSPSGHGSNQKTFQTSSDLILRNCCKDFRSWSSNLWMRTYSNVSAVLGQKKDQHTMNVLNGFCCYNLSWEPLKKVKSVVAWMTVITSSKHNAYYLNLWIVQFRYYLRAGVIWLEYCWERHSTTNITLPGHLTPVVVMAKPWFAGSLTRSKLA